MVNALQIMHGLEDAWGKTEFFFQRNPSKTFRKLPFPEAILLILTESQQNLFKSILKLKNRLISAMG